MPNVAQSWVAGENIEPRRILRADAANLRQALKATLGYMPIGVSHEGGIYAPIPEAGTQYAAITGGACRVYGPDEECEIDVDDALAIAIDDPVAPNASAKAQPGIHGFPIIGYALSSGTAAKKVRVRIKPEPRLDRSNTVLTKTADYTLALADLGKVLSNVGAGGAITFTLPTAVVGYEVSARVGVAQELRLDPAVADTISLPSTGVPGAAGKYLTANAIGETVHLKCRIAGTWDCMDYTGTWTSE